MAVPRIHRHWYVARITLPRTLPVLLLSLLVVSLQRVYALDLSVSALPATVLGTAVAFYVGFKNNQAYERFWEARTIWGSIVNLSRSWGAATIDFIRPPPGARVDASTVHRELAMRHVAWTHAVRLQLRDRSNWGEALRRWLPRHEAEELHAQPSVATYLLKVQSRRIEELVEDGWVTSTARHLELRTVLRDLLASQGMAERIKNTPLVPHYTTAATIFVWLYILLVPFSLLDVLRGRAAWLAVPISMLIGWIYDTMDRIGRLTEDPFDGVVSDVPMNVLCRAIEIELLAMLGDRDLPERLPAGLPD